MEGVMKEWKEEEAEDEEEVGLIKRQAHMHINITTTENVETLDAEHTNGFSGLNNGGLKFCQAEVNSCNIENITLHPSDPIISGDSASLNNVTTESERVGIITENMQLVKEINLESLHQKPSTRGFYCPNLPDSSKYYSEIPQDEHGQLDGSRNKHSRQGVIASASAVAIPKKPSIDISEKSEQPPRLEEVLVRGGNTVLSASTTLAATTQRGVVQESGSSKTLEILRSIVYGGLIESIASLGTVTSLASSGATTLNIIVLSLANLIGGLFILVNNICALESEQPRINTQASTVVDRYYQVLGKRENFFLHVCIAILSFIIFGLVPPLVYGFTIYKSNNMVLTLVAVAGASVICITILSIAKAYIQRPNTYLTYLKTVLHYLRFITFHPSDTVISVDSTSLNKETTESESVGITTENMQLVEELSLESLYQKPPTHGFFCPNCRACIQKVLLLNKQPVRELYLESLYQKPPAQGFCCPNCRACIQKVLILETAWEATSVPSQPPSPTETFRCVGCFSFLIPIGSWFFRGLVRENDVSTIEGLQHLPDHISERLSDEGTKATPEITLQAPDQVNTAADSGKQILLPEQVMSDAAGKASNEEEDHITIDSSKHFSEIPQDEHSQDGSKNKHSHWGVIASASAVAIPKKPQIDISYASEQAPWLEEVIVDVSASTALAATTQTSVIQESGSGKTWEILRSIVYGGLVESIASLCIVTYSSSSDATTLSILVLSLANLIGGLFILAHNIWDLKSEHPRPNNQTDADVDRYNQVLGKRENFFLHVCIAVSSFIIFWLVPPLVYAFTFTESNDKDLKLAVAAGASALCITLLSIAKARIQRPNMYLKTVFYYVSIGALASIISYLAGDLIENLVGKLGWFDTESSSFTLLLPDMSTEKPRIGSY